MKKLVLLLAVISHLFSILKAQNEQQKSKVIREFDYAYALIVSDDESVIAVLTNDNRLEFFQLETMSLLQTVKVSRNAWLNKAFFDDTNSFLYYDYGMQTSTKYKRINIKTGTKEKVECRNVLKGCSFISYSTCNDETQWVRLKSKKLAFFYNPDKHIEMHQIFE